MLPMYGVQVQPLVRELRSHMLCGQEFFFLRKRVGGDKGGCCKALTLR